MPVCVTNERDIPPNRYLGIYYIIISLILYFSRGIFFSFLDPVIHKAQGFTETKPNTFHIMLSRFVLQCYIDYVLLSPYFAFHCLYYT